jgi:hypothetical protein
VRVDAVSPSELEARVLPLERRIAEQDAKIAELLRVHGGEETPQQWAKRTGRSVAAAHKFVQREAARQAAGKPARFLIVRRSRAVFLRGAE